MTLQHRRVKMTKCAFLALFLLWFVTRSTSADSSDERKTLARHKRWLWGGCGLIPYCDKCINSHICVKCEAGYMFIEYRGRTSKKTVQCTRTCPKGYRVKKRTTGPSCVYTNKVCKVPHCNTCHPRRTTSCMKCSHGFYRFKPSVTDNARCVRKCPRWCSATTRRDGTKECLLNATECRGRVPHCELCLDKIWCRKCQPGYLTYFSSVNLTMDCVKKCPSKFKPVKSEYFGQYCAKRRDRRKCRTIPHCQHCPNKTRCRRCSKRYLKLKLSGHHSTQCVLKCPDGFKRKANRCVPDETHGCRGDICMLCESGFYRAKRGVCLHQCPKGFYIVGSFPKFCLRCPDGCAKCIHNNKCYRCKRGYYKLKTKQGTYCVQSCPLGYTTLQRKKQHLCRLLD